MPSAATRPKLSRHSEGTITARLTRQKWRGSGVLAIRCKVRTPARSTPACPSHSAVPRPSTTKSGMSGRRRPNSAAIRAKTARPLFGSGLTNVRCRGVGSAATTRSGRNG